MAKNTSTQDKDKNQISIFSDILSDIRSILSDFSKEIPEVVERIVYERLNGDQDKLSIMPGLEENLQSLTKYLKQTLDFM